jgi:uncharacterized membrane protein YkoI
MSRHTISRRTAAVAIAVSVGTGLGAGAVGLLSVASADTTTAGTTAGTTVGTTADTATPGSGPAATPLTADQAMAVATQASPGRVVEVEQETDEPTGLRYDVTVRHDDGTATEIEVDAATGQILSTELDDDHDGS